MVLIMNIKDPLKYVDYGISRYIYNHANTMVCSILILVLHVNININA